MKLYGRKFKIENPKIVDILIWDETNSHYVRRVLNKSYSVGVFKTRPEEIFIGFRLLLNFLYILPKIKISEILNSKQGFLKAFLKQARFLYFIAFFETIKAKAIITIIDNCGDFHWLSKNCRKWPFIAIQNGFRLSSDAIGYKGFYLQHYFCFGENEKHQFSKINYTVENFYPVGSLLASLHYERNQKNESKFDILIVSSWRGNIGFTKDVQDTMKSMRIMDELIAKFLIDKKLRVAIITRSEKNSEHWYIPEIGSNEKEYYKSIYGNEIKIITTDFNERNIYPLIQKSSLIISFLSTAILEAFGIGKKVLFCNFTGSDFYHGDFHTELVTNDSRFEVFSKKIDSMLNLHQEVYYSKLKKLQNYYMRFPQNGNYTEKAISDQIDKIIKTKKDLNEK